jgi:hypothetical protein
MTSPEYSNIPTGELQGMLSESTASEEKDAISEELSRRYADDSADQAQAQASASQRSVFAPLSPETTSTTQPQPAVATAGTLGSSGEAGIRPQVRVIGAVVAGIVALLFIVAGFIYLAVPADSVPSVMGRIAGSTGHHPLRAAGCLIVGVVLGVVAWFILKYQPKSQRSS